MASAVGLFTPSWGRTHAASTLPPQEDAAIEARAAELERLHAVIIARNGEIVMERRLRGPALDRPVNVKSVSKAVLSALTGLAIGHGVLAGTGQTFVTVLNDAVPPGADPRLERVTIGHLLSMQAGLESTSGAGYGAWVTSPNWIRYVLTRPFAAEPGGRMIYSTGTSHLLSAVLTKASGRSTLELAREWLGRPLGITIPPWPRDPQGIYFGGNDMLMSPRDLVAFGELYRNDGIFGGRRILPEGWVVDSWQRRTVSAWTGDDYGYGWFTRRSGKHEVHFAWGYGGQMVFVVPSLSITAVMTSDPSPRPRGDGHVKELHRLLDDLVVAAIADGAT
jgi:CubicO group peptidase (beta-lactamase class C family)